MRNPRPRRRLTMATSSRVSLRTASKPPLASKGSRRTRMNWPLATAGPEEPPAAGSQSSSRASRKAKTGGISRFSPHPRTSWKPAMETASRRRSAAAACARASRSGAWRASASVRRSQGERTSREPDQSAWTLPRQPGGRGAAADRSSRRGSAGRRAATSPAVPSVEPSSITRTLGEAVCASRVSTQSRTLWRSSRTGSRTMVSGTGRTGGGSDGAARRRSSVLSASPRRPAPRRRESARAGLKGFCAPLD